jgi:hypothetical protein
VLALVAARDLQPGDEVGEALSFFSAFSFQIFSFQFFGKIKTLKNLEKIKLGEKVGGASRPRGRTASRAAGGRRDGSGWVVERTQRREEQVGWVQV